MNMQTIDARQIADQLPYDQLIDALCEAFRVGATVPERTVHSIAVDNGHDGTLPLIRGEWLGGGQHLDLVGAFTLAMREADNEAMRRARVFVDTYTGALAESGEIIQAIGEGFLNQQDIVADLAKLAQGEVAGRDADSDITLFKSVGTALEDLAAAELMLRNNCCRPVTTFTEH